MIMKSRISMKAVLLVAAPSDNARFFPLAHNRTKHMMPVAGRPLLERSILELKEAGVDEILLVVGYQKEVLKDYFKDGSVLSVKIHFIDQDFIEGKGTGIATSFAKNFAGNDPFLLIYGDLQYDAKTIRDIIRAFQQNDPDAMLALSRVDDPSQFGIVELDDRGLVTRILEKPEPGQSESDLANAGIYVFKNVIFDAIARTEVSSRDEIELTDSIQILINDGRKVVGYDLDGAWWRDIGRAHDLLDANAHYFTKIKKLIKGNIERNVQIKGEVYIGANTIVRSGTYIEGPVYIGYDCEIGPNAYLRPNTYIGDRCRIGNACEIKASIIMAGTKISHLSYVGDSVIGENVNFGAATIAANLRLDHKQVALREQGALIPTGLRKLGVLCGDNVNVGCNTNLEPGVRIGANSIIGPNVTISEDIEPDTLVYIKWTEKEFYIKKKIGQSSEEEQ